MVCLCSPPLMHARIQISQAVPECQFQEADAKKSRNLDVSQKRPRAKRKEKPKIAGFRRADSSVERYLLKKGLSNIEVYAPEQFVDPITSPFSHLEINTKYTKDKIGGGRILNRAAISAALIRGDVANIADSTSFSINNSTRIHDDSRGYNTKINNANPGSGTNSPNTSKSHNPAVGKASRGPVTKANDRPSMPKLLGLWDYVP
ncbi:hypothetical protein Pelo_12945 [Pelomyxa schiedti]|nr:hypothetical protein Pelo_12945 [Pelomyxa schiedti]